MGCLPCIEPLENRNLLSISWIHHIINVQGAANAPNTITVGLNPGGASVYATLSYPKKKGVYTQTKTFALSEAIRFVNIVGGNSNDLITVNQSNGSFPLTTHINTHNGNDTVMGGDEPDRIICGAGIDNINSGNGNDTLRAGRGPDTLVGGNGNDQLISGTGHDALIAGNGNNIFTDPFGNITLQGGSGHDIYVLKDIRLDPDNNYDPAKDKLEIWRPPASTDSLLNNIVNGILDYGSFL